MYTELEAERAADPERLPVHIAGVNEIGHSSGFVFIVPSQTRPWLQDAAPATYLAWRVGLLRPASPRIVYRDVVILDAQNRAVGVYNLSTYNLGLPANYQTLKNMLRGAATPAAQQ